MEPDDADSWPVILDVCDADRCTCLRSGLVRSVLAANVGRYSSRAQRITCSGEAGVTPPTLTPMTGKRVTPACGYRRVRRAVLGVDCDARRVRRRPPPRARGGGGRGRLLRARRLRLSHVMCDDGQYRAGEGSEDLADNRKRCTLHILDEWKRAWRCSGRGDSILKDSHLRDASPGWTGAKSGSPTSLSPYSPPGYAHHYERRHEAALHRHET